MKNSSLPLFLIIALGLLLRIYGLGANNLWYDEFDSFRMSRVFEFSLLKNGYNPPLYFSLLSVWIKLFGGSEFALRSLSMVFGLFSVFVIYALGRIFFNPRIGLLSAFILSISPMHIWYSQEARGYSLSTFMVILVVYSLVLALKNNRVYSWAGFIISSTLALYTNYFSFFIVILTGIVFLFRPYRALLKHYLTSLCFILFAFLPGSFIFVHQIGSISDGFWIPTPEPASILITFANFNTGFNATSFIFVFTLIVFSLLYILGVKLWWAEKKRELIFLMSFLFIPVFSAYLISQKLSVYLDRQLMLFSPFYYMIIAAGLGKIYTRVIRVVAYSFIVIPVLICLNNYWSYHMPLPWINHIGVFVKKPVKPAADYINNRYKEGDFIAYTDLSILNIFYYMPYVSKKQRVYFFIESKLGSLKYQYLRLIKSKKFWGENFTIYNLSKDESRVPGVKNIGQLYFERLWLISSSWERGNKLGVYLSAEHILAVRDFMRDNYLLIDSKEFDGIFIDFYSRKIKH